MPNVDCQKWHKQVVIEVIAVEVEEWIDILHDCGSGLVALGTFDDDVEQEGVEQG